jgi:hypothetical protein
MTTIARTVLLLASDDEQLPAVEAALDDAGYEVRRCVEPGQPTFPCAGLDGGAGCPLDDGRVDVALDVRVHPWPHPTPREVGVRCALRRSVPLAVAGRVPGNPFGRWADAVEEGTTDVAALCERAIASSLERHRHAVIRAVSTVLAVHGDETPAVAAEIDRRGGRLHATITAAVPDALRTVAVARAGSALRGVDREAKAIEIDLRQPDWHALQQGCVEPWLDD